MGDRTPGELGSGGASPDRPGSADHAGVKDRIDSSRTRCPSFAEQNERVLVGYLGVRPLKLEVDLTSQRNLRCIMCYCVLDQFSKGKRFDWTAEQFVKMAERILPDGSRSSL